MILSPWETGIESDGPFDFVSELTCLFWRKAGL